MGTHVCALPAGDHCSRGRDCLGCSHAQPKKSAAPIFRRMLMLEVVRIEGALRRAEALTDLRAITDCPEARELEEFRRMRSLHELADAAFDALTRRDAVGFRELCDHEVELTPFVSAHSYTGNPLVDGARVASVRGAEAVHKWWIEIFRAYPDMTLSLVSVIGQFGQTAVCRTRWFVGGDSRGVPMLLTMRGGSILGFETFTPWVDEYYYLEGDLKLFVGKIVARGKASEVTPPQPAAWIMDRLDSEYFPVIFRDEATAVKALGSRLRREALTAPGTPQYEALSRASVDAARRHVEAKNSEWENWPIALEIEEAIGAGDQVVLVLRYTTVPNTERGIDRTVEVWTVGRGEIVRKERYRTRTRALRAVSLLAEP